MPTKTIKSYLINSAIVVAMFVVMTMLMQANIITKYYQGIIVFICINIIVASSLNLAVGFLGQLALGHAGFMAIGAYGAALFSIAMKDAGLPPDLLLIISLIVGGLLTAVFGYLIGLPALRLKGDYLAIITLGFGEIIRVIINNIEITGKAQGLVGIPKLANFTNSFWITVVVIFLLYTLTHSRQGRAFMSIREDEIAAEAVGIHTTKYKAIAFTISTFFAGIGGGLFAHYLAFLDPNTFNFMKSVEIVVIVVLGGMGSLTGTIIAAVILTILPELLRQFSEYRLLVYSLLLVVMMIFRPQGLLGTAEFSIKTLFNGAGAMVRPGNPEKEVE